MKRVGILFCYWVSAGLFSGAKPLVSRRISTTQPPFWGLEKFRVKARLRLAYNDLTSLDGLQGLGSLEAMGTETFHFSAAWEDGES